MRQNDIRPDKMMTDKEVAIQHDIAFLNRELGSWVEADCPACGVGDREEFGSKSGFSFVSCKGCRTVYTSPRPSENLLARFYENSENYEYWNQHIFPATEEIRKNLIFQPRVERVLGALENEGITDFTLLEVGAAFGWFCEGIMLSGAAKEVIAVEPSLSLAHTCSEKGITTFASTLGALRLDRYVDVVAAFEVLEHVFDPARFLEQCAALLGNGGKLFLSCPNVFGIDVQALGTESSTFQYEHLNYFHPESIKVLLERVGFSDVDVTTPGQLDMDILREWAKNAPEALQHDRFLRRLAAHPDANVVDRFQKFIADNGMSSHMFVSATKTT